MIIQVLSLNLILFLLLNGTEIPSAPFFILIKKVSDKNNYLCYNIVV